MTAESAVRELAIAIAGTMNQIMHHNEIERTVVLITTALKRCRNEALEEAAVIMQNKGYGYNNLHAAAIRNLKEPE